MNTVFQNYALFPHMTVFQNIAYGLKVLGISKSEQKERVMAALSLVRLAGFERRMPSQLSGGQRAARSHRTGGGSPAQGAFAG